MSGHVSWMVLVGLACWFLGWGAMSGAAEVPARVRAMRRVLARKGGAR